MTVAKAVTELQDEIRLYLELMQRNDRRPAFVYLRPKQVALLKKQAVRDGEAWQGQIDGIPIKVVEP